MRPRALIRIAGIVVPFLLLLSFAAGCKKAPVVIAPEIASSDEALYKLGEAQVKKDQEKALLYLRQVIDSFPKSFYAQRAKLLIADTYFRKGDEGSMVLAAAEYREFIKSYPYSPSAAYCQFQIAMTFYKKALKPGRDPSKTIQALSEFKKTVEEFPASDQSKAAQEKIKDCEQRLAAHITTIAEVYIRSRAYKASISRLSDVMTTYPDFKRMDEVYYDIGNCQLLLRQYDEAVPYLTKLISDYPKSPYVKKATALLKRIEILKKAGPVKAKVKVKAK